MEEISKAENTISKSSPNGIRDLAIMMLASRCGLRCGDIVLLKIDSISMDTGLLSITQQKTEEPLSMVLPTQVLNTIRNYISDDRPDSPEKALFLSSLPPFSALTPAVVYRVVSNAFKQAGVNTEGKKKGPHTLRASMASSMVNDDVPYDAVRRILGHRNPQTIKHYASIHVEKLREYSLTPPKASGNFLAILKGGN
jgi:integrase